MRIGKKTLKGVIKEFYIDRGRLLVVSSNEDFLRMASYEVIPTLFFTILASFSLYSFCRKLEIWLLITFIVLVSLLVYYAGLKHVLIVNFRLDQITGARKTFWRSAYSNKKNVKDVSCIEKKWNAAADLSFEAVIRFADGSYLEICPTPKAADILCAALRQHGCQCELMTIKENIGIHSKTLIDKSKGNE